MKRTQNTLSSFRRFMRILKEIFLRKNFLNQVRMLALLIQFLDTIIRLALYYLERL